MGGHDISSQYNQKTPAPSWRKSSGPDRGGLRLDCPGPWAFSLLLDENTLLLAVIPISHMQTDGNTCISVIAPGKHLLLKRDSKSGCISLWKNMFANQRANEMVPVPLGKRKSEKTSNTKAHCLKEGQSLTKKCF